jgi:MYXO-CTERM domain-containing protein
MRLAPLALPLVLLISASPVAQAAKAPLTGGPTPGGSAVFTTDPFGYLVCDPDELTATDPADKTKALPPARWCSGQILSIHELGTKPPQSVGLGDATELPLTKTFIDASNLKLFDPAIDVITGSTRTSAFHVATQGALAALFVKLSQTVTGTELVQVYSLKNQGSVPLNLRIDGVLDGDIDTGLGSNQNLGIHDALWPGASAVGSVAATISDSTQLIGVTLALQGGSPAGYRTLRASAPGYEIYRVPALGGYYDTAFLNGLFTFPATAFGNGVNRPFTDETPDDLDANGISDAAGDLVIGLQTTLTLDPGAVQSVTLTTTLVSGGPYLVAPMCPLPDAGTGAAIDIPLAADSVFGAPVYSITAGVLPAGLALVNGHIVGKPTAAGLATFDLVVTDARGRHDEVACSLKVVGCSSDCAPTSECLAAGACDPVTSTCTYQARADGSPCSSGECLAGSCVGEGSGSPGSAGATGSASAGSSGGAGTGTLAAGSGGGAPSGPSSVGATGSGGNAGDGSIVPAGGCGCAIGGDATRGSAWALVGIALLAGRRRERGSKTR